MTDTVCTARVRGKFGGDHNVFGQYHLAAGLPRASEDIARRRLHVRLLHGSANCNALCGEEGVGHRAAKHQHVHATQQVAGQAKFRGHLGSADDCCQGMLGMAKHGIERLQLGLHQPSGVGGQPCAVRRHHGASADRPAGVLE